MIQCLASHFGGLYEYGEVLDDLLLTTEICDLGRADIILELPVGGAKRFLFAVQIGVCHCVNLQWIFFNHNINDQHQPAYSPGIKKASASWRMLLKDICQNLFLNDNLEALF